MIISFSGAQSTGKTTLLKYLQQYNRDKAIFVPEVTRLVKRLYDFPINEDGTDLTQMTICAEHLKNAFLKEHQENDVILDRCGFDGWVYTSWLYKNKKVGANTQRFSEDVFYETYKKYDVIFYTSPDDVPIEVDGERSCDEDFRNEIITLFESRKYWFEERLVELKGSVEERLITIRDTLHPLGLSLKI